MTLVMLVLVNLKTTGNHTRTVPRYQRHVEAVPRQINHNNHLVGKAVYLLHVQSDNIYQNTVHLYLLTAVALKDSLHHC